MKYGNRINSLNYLAKEFLETFIPNILFRHLKMGVGVVIERCSFIYECTLLETTASHQRKMWNVELIID